MFIRDSYLIHSHVRINLFAKQLLVEYWKMRNTIAD